MLEGSVQRATNRIRVNVQLIDAESGDHLWAERFDNPCRIFDMQDEIVAHLATPSTRSYFAEARRAALSPSPDLDGPLFSRNERVQQGAHSGSPLAGVRRLFERALALDPDNVDAIVGAPRTESAFAWSHMSDDRATRPGGG